MKIINLRLQKYKNIYIEKIAQLEIELWNVNNIKSYINSINKALFRSTYNILLAIENDIPLGYIELDICYSWDEQYSNNPIMKICGLYVTPSARGKGIATTLIKESEKYAKKLKCTKIASDYLENNINSKNLHNNLGFKETSKLINVIKDI